MWLVSRTEGVLEVDRLGEIVSCSVTGCLWSVLPLSVL